VIIKNVPPNSVVAGNPGKILRQRKESENIYHKTI